MTLKYEKLVTSKSMARPDADNPEDYKKSATLLQATIIRTQAYFAVLVWDKLRYTKGFEA